ncbi:MAG TPA: aspartate--tRNA ligase [Planctomycetaceae bacterium]|nr:aspartate--tRNA ligase [Planctomycetales bacterium]HAA62434.1 aspartate--tRNA ligase [Planctomycetaceae bacterium]|tara:strand:- start:4963 stop:6741 length:1779 start_codon:yes stop_codon:yes gene_type:complete
MLRSHTCGELRSDDIGQSVTLGGWVQNYRDHRGLVFIDLRDRYGITQIVFNLSHDEQMQEVARALRSEDVIQVEGEVISRSENINPKLATGEIEIKSTGLVVFSKSKTPPFEPTTAELPNAELRLKYRFLDLRRDELQKNLVLRHKMTKAARDYFDQNDFLEIETPMLGRSTPEGARDYLVPSRVHPGSFYALPQSPQIYKQILMIAGYDRYVQMARCFRDEDLRADRQPEFTQVDVEMAFVQRDDILEIIDGLMAHLVKELRGEELALPLPRFTHAEVMERYGTDKPDLRFGMELIDIGEIAGACGFGVFKNTIESGGRVRGINARGAAETYSRKMIDELTDYVSEHGAKGLAFFRVADGSLDSPIAKFLDDEHHQAIIESLSAEPGDLLFFVADSDSVTSSALSALRNRLGVELELYDPSELKIAWVVDFPLLGWNEDEQRWDAEHHPFCFPVEEDLESLTSDPGAVRAQSYDLVCNGYEAGSGSIRIHDPVVQQQVFDLLGINSEEAEMRFGFLLEALRYGAPPHGGIALGLDRWVMMFAGHDNIRDVIAFPKTQKAADLLSGAPSPVDDRQLRELSIQTDLPDPTASS